MRIRTLVLIALVAVLAIASLPTSHSQISANSPQNVGSVISQDRSIEIATLATYEKEIKKDIGK
jgi:hypothetical protein